MKHIVLLVAVLILAIPAVPVISAENGAADMMLYGGKRGKVPFPHRTHQEALGDCKACHDLFPQEPGAIERLKKTGDLKKKQVMNRSCVKCHKTTKKSGGKAGPVTCSQCHIRE